MTAPPRLKFLVVDDFSTMRRIVRGLLKELGYTDCDEAEDGAVAYEKLRNGNFDFVVSDINMPNMDGIELLSTLKTNATYKSVPVLMVTTEGSQAKVMQALVDLLRPSTRGDTLIFYFAGHGHTVKNYGEEMGYIIPTSSPNPNRDLVGHIKFRGFNS